MPMNSLATEIRTSFAAVAIFVVVFCGLYPLTVWVAGRVLFPNKTDGSLIIQKGTIVGSELIGQKFDIFTPGLRRPEPVTTPPRRPEAISAPSPKLFGPKSGFESRPIEPKTNLRRTSRYRPMR
jgi:K+-transporting ATPase c subunit